MQQVNKVYISKQALINNHQQLQQLVIPAQVAPVVKSNAYGHGLATIAPILQKQNPPFLVVDSIQEAWELQTLGVNTKILVLGYIEPENLAQIDLEQIHLTAFSQEMLEVYSSKVPGASVHLFIDSGMHREGIQFTEFKQLASKLHSYNVQITGISSHFADADNPQTQAYTQWQLRNFREIVQLLSQHGVKPEWKHIAASGGALRLQADEFNIVRTGLLSYGISPLQPHDPDNSKLELQPVLRLETEIAQVKTLNAEAYIGYNGTYQTSEPTKVAILPLGYNDGLDRRLSNQGVVSIQDSSCQILGQVSMNITVVDVSHLPDVAVGDRVEVFSNQAHRLNAIANSANTAGMIPYDLLVGIKQELPRVLTD